MSAWYGATGRGNTRRCGRRTAGLRKVGAPVGLRSAILMLDGYTVLVVLAVIASCITRPRVVCADEVRIRYGAFFDLRIPASRSPRYGRSGTSTRRARSRWRAAGWPWRSPRRPT